MEISYYDDQFRRQVEGNLGRASDQAELAGKIGGSLHELESQLIDKYSQLGNLDDNAPGRAAIEQSIHKLDVMYRRAMRVFELFQTLMKNAHEVMQRAINNMRVS